jgi:hypothetical protein
MTPGGSGDGNDDSSSDGNDGGGGDGNDRSLLVECA